MVKDPEGLRNTVTQAEVVLAKVREFWQALYAKRNVRLPWFAEQVMLS